MPTGLAFLLQEGGLDASIVFLKPGIAAVLRSTILRGCPDKLSYPAGRNSSGSRRHSEYRCDAGLPGLQGQGLRPVRLVLSRFWKIHQADLQDVPATELPRTFVADCRDPQEPQISDPMFVGDQRTVRSTPLFSADGVVAFGFERRSSPSHLPW